MAAAPALAPLDPSSAAERELLISVGRRHDARGWLLGTGGNLSARTARGFVVTASGCHKGMLTSEDFVELDLDGGLVAGAAGARPSAEASIHLAIYRSFPAIGAVLHVHTPTGALLRPAAATRPPATGAITLAGLEMLKAWGFWEGTPTVALPLFENHPEVPRIAKDIEAFYATAAEAGLPEAPALCILGHGFTAWGKDIPEANRHLETAEFLGQVHLLSLRQG